GRGRPFLCLLELWRVLKRDGRNERERGRKVAARIQYKYLSANDNALVAQQRFNSGGGVCREDMHGFWRF
ncbi:MAG: hypothetical protein ACRDSJ_13875, partial [Rubrobacteraceae bacterium]